MLTPEIKAFLRAEIARQVQIILSGTSGENNEHYEDIEEMIPGMPTQPSRPVMHPYGFASRAVKGILQVVGRQGEHPSNRLVLGHRDKGKPDDLKTDEVVLYNKAGERVYLRTDRTVLKSAKLQLGSASATENLMLGKVTQAVLKEVLSQVESLANELSSLSQALATHDHAGPPPTNPAPYISAAAGATAVKAAVQVQRTSKVESGDIISDKLFGEK